MAEGIDWDLGPRVLAAFLLLILLGKLAERIPDPDAAARARAMLHDTYGREIVSHVEMKGESPRFGVYRLVSFDKGRTWWRVSYDGRQVSPASSELVGEASQPASVSQSP